jgi:threonine synthase
MEVKYRSTNLLSPEAGFKEALLRGQAPDKGLYTPDPKAIPKFSMGEMAAMRGMDYPEIAHFVTRKFVAGVLPEKELKRITEEAYNFDVPIEPAGPGKYVMRLDHGPTASFKDFAARMMARQIQYFIKENNRKMTILVATSGDTGSAVASAFYGLDNVKVVVLFPAKEVTAKQRKQMTTLGGNIIAIGVAAKFDNCQYLAKQAFGDEDLGNLNLSSANSINIGRLLPQMVYYFYAYSRVSESGQIVFSVPSGNFGNGTAAVMAKMAGLPIAKLVLPVNENDEFPVFLRANVYNPVSPSKNCISNAMNVGHPSNLARIVALYGGHMDEKGIIRTMPNMYLMRNDIFSTSVSDLDTRNVMATTYNTQSLLLEPHGAVAWEGLHRYLDSRDTSLRDNVTCVSLETAHPAKFSEIVQLATGITPAEPDSLAKLDSLKENLLNINNNYAELKEVLRGLR